MRSLIWLEMTLKLLDWRIKRWFNGWRVVVVAAKNSLLSIKDLLYSYSYSLSYPLTFQLLIYYTPDHRFHMIWLIFHYIYHKLWPVIGFTITLFHHIYSCLVSIDFKWDVLPTVDYHNYYYHKYYYYKYYYYFMSATFTFTIISFPFFMTGFYRVFREFNMGHSLALI